MRAGAHFEDVRGRAITDEFLAAIADTRPTLSKEILESLDSDTEQFGRY